MLRHCWYGQCQHEGRTCSSAEKGQHNKRHNELTIDFHVIVSYGVSILAVYNNLTDSVKYHVEEFTGIRVKKINMYVEGVRVID